MDYLHHEALDLNFRVPTFSQLALMLYFILWAVFLVVCIIALPVASMLDKRQALSAISAVDDSAFGQEEYEDDSESEPQAGDDAFGGAGEDFPAEEFPAGEMPEAGEPVLDDFSAFDEDFK